MKVVNMQLDAADPTFVYSHLNELPFLRDKIKNGASGILNTYMSSSIAWSSFWTAQPPSVHGIESFWRRSEVENANKPIINNRTHIKAPLAYHIMEKQGLRVGLVNCIYTYPRWDINGYLITDWTMPIGTTDYCYPDDIKGELEDMGYMEAMDNFKQYHGYLEGQLSDDADSIYRCAVELFEKTKEVSIYLMNRYDWDFHATLFRFLDTVQHFCINNEAKLLEAYQRADRALAEIATRVDALNDETCWLINSDHGAMLEFPDRVLKGGHDTSGFYCFTCDELFWKGQTRTLRIEDLMPTVLHLFDITMSDVHGRVAMELFRPTEPTSGTSVEERLRALKYID